MKTLLTGMNGTVAPVLAQALVQAGHSVTAWNRSAIPIDNLEAMREFIARERPDWFFHLATGSAAWAETVARICFDQRIKFLFTGSVSVFSASQRGAFTVDVLPQPDDDYGRYKLECEQRIQAVCPDALIVRLGWQIGTTLEGNQMAAYLDRTFNAQRYIDASVAWYPACSFLADTAESLTHLMQTLPPGLYHLDANPGLSFYDIAVALNALHSNRWTVKPGATPVQNNRLIDARVQVNPITRRFALHQRADAQQE